MITLINDLFKALEQKGSFVIPNFNETKKEEEEKFYLSKDLQEIFIHPDDQNSSQEEQQNKILERFEIARKLYEVVKNKEQILDNEGKHFAIFYRMKDMEDLQDAYINSLAEIGTKLVKYIDKQEKKLDRDELIQFFVSQRKNDVKRDIIDGLLLNKIDEILLQTDLECFFQDTLEDEIIERAEQKFFFLERTADEAREVGTIYEPLDHVWGMNVAWILAVASKKLPIKILSVLDEKNMLRSSVKAKPDGTPLYKENPSAFALEIAVVKKMGYSLKFSGRNITLMPPPNFVYFFTKGILGEGILPTKSEQLDSYKLSMKVENLYKQLVRNTSNLSEKINVGENLINALQFIHIDNLKEILTMLPTKEKNSLHEALLDKSFSDQKYENLKMEIDLNLNNYERPESYKMKN